MIVEQDQVGVVMDGPDVGEDVDVQRSKYTITASFHGFHSMAHGISHYIWAVGTEPLTDDVMPFISEGVVEADDADQNGKNVF